MRGDPYAGTALCGIRIGGLNFCSELAAVLQLFIVRLVHLESDIGVFGVWLCFSVFSTPYLDCKLIRCIWANHQGTAIMHCSGASFARPFTFQISESSIFRFLGVDKGCLRHLWNICYLCGQSWILLLLYLVCFPTVPAKVMCNSGLHNYPHVQSLENSPMSLAPTKPKLSKQTEDVFGGIFLHFRPREQRLSSGVDIFARVWQYFTILRNCSKAKTWF